MTLREARRKQRSILCDGNAARCELLDHMGARRSKIAGPCGARRFDFGGAVRRKVGRQVSVIESRQHPVQQRRDRAIGHRRLGDAADLDQEGPSFSGTGEMADTAGQGRHVIAGATAAITLMAARAELQVIEFGGCGQSGL